MVTILDDETTYGTLQYGQCFEGTPVKGGGQKGYFLRWSGRDESLAIPLELKDGKLTIKYKAPTGPEFSYGVFGPDTPCRKLDQKVASLNEVGHRG